jgi:hypothetical protein
MAAVRVFVAVLAAGRLGVFGSVGTGRELPVDARTPKYVSTDIRRAAIITNGA